MKPQLLEKQAQTAPVRGAQGWAGHSVLGKASWVVLMSCHGQGPSEVETMPLPWQGVQISESWTPPGIPTAHKDAGAVGKH